MTRRDERLAGVAALAGAVMLAASLLLTGHGPSSRNPVAVVAWYAEHATGVRLGSLLWLGAMLALVAFTVLLRDALLALTADRWWANVLMQQGAAVFASVAVVAAATQWATAGLAVRSGSSPETVAAIWNVHDAMMHFASWGLTVPLVAAAVALWRHSLGGRLAAVLGLGVAVAVLTPLTWSAGLIAFAAWLAVAGIAILAHTRRSVRHPEPAGQTSAEAGA